MVYERKRNECIVWNLKKKEEKKYGCNISSLNLYGYSNEYLVMSVYAPSIIVWFVSTAAVYCCWLSNFFSLCKFLTRKKQKNKCITLLKTRLLYWMILWEIYSLIWRLVTAMSVQRGLFLISFKFYCI